MPKMKAEKKKPATSIMSTWLSTGSFAKDTIKDIKALSKKESSTATNVAIVTSSTTSTFNFELENKLFNATYTFPLSELKLETDPWDATSTFISSKIKMEDKAFTISSAFSMPDIKSENQLLLSRSAFSMPEIKSESAIIDRTFSTSKTKLKLETATSSNHHDPVTMIVGVSRKSSRPHISVLEALTAECYERARKYARFYLVRCHDRNGQKDCCQPREESVVIFGSSNTDFAHSKANGIDDIRKLLKQVESGERVVLVFSQTNGLCTNMIGFAGFLKPFMQRGMRFEMMVWWSNSEYYQYDLNKVVEQFYAKASGLPIEPYYEEFLAKMARVAGNKELMAQGSHANKAEGLGLRNVRPIDPDDYSPEREIVEISMAPAAKQERLVESLKSANRAVAEIEVFKNADGEFISPIDSRTFVSFDALYNHVVNTTIGSRRHPWSNARSATAVSIILSKGLASGVISRDTC